MNSDDISFFQANTQNASYTMIYFKHPGRSQLSVSETFAEVASILSAIGNAAPAPAKAEEKDGGLSLFD